MPTDTKKQSLFKVNLFINKGDQPKLYLQISKWLLSSGRYIVIFVELLVIGAFVSRYKLDADLASIQEQIKEIAPYVESLKGDESIIKKVQFQLSSISQIRSNNPNFSQIFMDIAKLTPKSTILTNITLEKDSKSPQVNLSITGQTPSNIELSAFIKALSKNPQFSNINLTNISFEGETIFTITGTLNQSGEKT